MGTIATVADVIRQAPAGMLVEERRLVAVDLDEDGFVLPSHGFEDNERIKLQAEGATGVLPDPLEAGVAYYAIASTVDRFQVAATEDGAAIDLTDVGTGRAYVVPEITDRIEAALELAEGKAQLQLDAHDWDSVVASHSLFLKAYIAKMAAREVMTQLGKNTEALTASIEQDLGDVRMAVKGGAFLDTERERSNPVNTSRSYSSGELPFSGETTIP